MLRTHKLVVLLDTGNIHNFLDPAVLRKVPLRVDSGVQLWVRVAKGATVLSSGFCSAVSLKLQGHSFSLDFYLLPLGGCDAVLGVDWLRILGPVLWDFQILTMEFGQVFTRVILKGMMPSDVTLEDGSHFLRSSPSGNKGFFLQLGPPSLLASALASSDSTPAPLQDLLRSFESIFAESKGLPPKRSHDYQIVLHDPQSISVRPYDIRTSKKRKSKRSSRSCWILGSSSLVSVHVHLWSCWSGRRMGVGVYALITEL
jgi:hypothetical protein